MEHPSHPRFFQEQKASASTSGDKGVDTRLEDGVPVVRDQVVASFGHLAGVVVTFDAGEETLDDCVGVQGGDSIVFFGPLIHALKTAPEFGPESPVPTPMIAIGKAPFCSPAATNFIQVSL